VSLTRPLGPPPNEQPGDIGGSQLGGGIMDQRWTDFFNLDSGCMINGMATSCSSAMGIVSSGAGVIGPANTTRWDPDANNGAGGYQFFHAYADGTEGWGAMSGIPGVTASGAPRRTDPPKLKPFDPNRPYDPNIEQPIHLNTSADYWFGSDWEFQRSKRLIPCPPTGQELAANPIVKRDLKNAFKLSKEGKIERGGWIYWNKTTGKVFTILKDPPTDDPLHPNLSDSYLKVFLNNPPSAKKGLAIVGDFHTHLETGGPDDYDEGLEQQRKVPGIIIDAERTWVYGPKRGMWYQDVKGCN
jgi:hypothetical protein